MKFYSYVTVPLFISLFKEKERITFAFTQETTSIRILSLQAAG